MTDTTILPRAMSIEEFLPLVGRDFQVDCTPKMATITLTEATPLRTAAGATRPPFTLFFHSAPEVHLISGLYAMQCGEFGPAAIHIAPVVRSPANTPGFTYQAVFN